MDDTQILKRIEEMVEAERELREQAAAHAAGSEVYSQLAALEISLDQCWDLLRQRRALRDSGGKPDDAQVRSETTVERYRQ